MTIPRITISVAPLLKTEVYQHIRGNYPPDALVPYPDMGAVPVAVALDRWTPKAARVALRLWPNAYGTWLLWRRETGRHSCLTGRNDAETIRTIPLYEADGATLTRIAHEWLYDRPRPAR